MKSYHLSNVMLAEKTGLSLQQINGILNAQKPITPEIALRLSRLFHFSEMSGAIALHPTKHLGISVKYLSLSKRAVFLITS
jgi:hypothetical protein